MLAQIVLRIVPLIGCTFLANMGALVSDVTRAVTVYNTAAAPVMLPLLVPYLNNEDVEITPSFLSALAGSALAGMTAVYCGVKNRGFGIRMQAMTIGFIILGMSSSTFTGLIAENYPRVIPVMQWALVLVGLLIGSILGTIAMKFETAVTMVATALLGAYSALLIVASMGFEFTNGLTISDIANGTTGCTIWGCHTALVVTIIYALIGLTNQMTFKNPEQLEALENPGCYKRWLQRIWLVTKTFCEPIFTLNDTLIELGREGVTPAEEKVAMDTFKTSLKKLISFLGNCTVLVTAASLLFSTIELFVTGVYLRTPSMTYLGIGFFIISLYIILTCLLGVTAFLMADEAPGKRFRTKIYLLLGFLVIPVAICAALLCYTLSDTSFGDVPWVTDFVGLTAERISETAGISADSLADDNATQVGGEMGGGDAVVLLRSSACADVRVACTQADIDSARDEIMRELPTVGNCLAGSAFGMIIVWVLICQAMGGWSFLACQICGFTTMLNFCHGVGVAYGAWWLHADSFEQKIAEAQRKEESLFNAMGIMASSLIVTSLVGMLGLKINTAMPRKLFLVSYFFLLLVVMTGTIVFYGFLYYFTLNLDEVVEQYWNDPLWNATKNQLVIRNMTQDEFTNVVTSGYDIIQVVAIVSMSYMLVSIFSTFYASKADAPGGAGGIGEGLATGLASSAIKVSNPIFGAGGDSDDEKE